MDTGGSRHFVGRTSELADLTEMAQAAVAGHGRLVVIAGEAGIGKTRLCQELADRTAALGAGVAWSACWEASGLPVLWPWSQLLDQLGVAIPSTVADVPDTDVARAGLLSSVTGLLRRATEARPWVLILDDVQWADGATVRLLAHVASVVRSMRLLVVVTVREAETEAAPFSSTLRRLGQSLRLAQMTVDEVRDVVAQALGDDPGEDVAAALHRLTAGNPLFAEELARSLHRAGSLGVLLGGDHVAVPPTVRAVLDERLAALSPSCREILEHAAVVGSEFRPSIVAASAAVPVSVVLAAAEEAETARIVAVAGPDDARFTHPLLRSVLYGDIGVARRSELHRRVGEAIEGHGADRSAADLAGLSHHYMMASASGTAEKAARFSALAARQALEALAYEEAVQLFDRALTAARLDPQAVDLGEVLVEAATACAAAGHHERARALYLRAADEARALGRSSQLASAALGLAGSGFEVTLFDEQQVALLEEALDAINIDDVAWRAKLEARLSVALSLAGQEERRAALASHAVQLAEASGDDAALASALAARSDAQAGPDHVHERARDAALIAAIGHRRGDYGRELLGRRLRLLACLESGDLPAVDREIHEFATLTEWLRQPSYRWYPLLWRAMRAAMRGQIAQQTELADAAQHMGHLAHSPNVEILLLAHRVFVWLELGELDTFLAETERWAPPGSWEELGIQMLPLAVTRPLFAGRPEEARAVLDRSAEALVDAPKDAEWLTLMAQIGDLCGKLGGHELVPWLYDTLLPYGELWSVDGIGAYAHGPVHRQLGTLAALLDRRDDAAIHFDMALTQNRAAGAELLVARTLLDRGTALADRASLTAARDAYRKIGIVRRVAEVEYLLRPEPPAGGPSRFCREGDVWMLSFAGHECRVRDSKGMRDLSRLLAAPRMEMAAVDLASPAGAPRQRDLGDTVDGAARAAYKARLIELESELDDADRLGDADRSVRLHSERDMLLAQLSAAYGLGGRPRRAGDPAERARTAVTARIRDAMRRIEAVHPNLGRHLHRSVRTGTFCVYDPDVDITWTT